jgi:hypothetical protein
LEVAGNIFVNTSGNPYAEIKTSGSGNNPYLKLTADTNSWTFQGTFSNANDDLLVLYNATTLLDLTKDGNLGLGVTPSAWRSNYKALQINTTGAVWSSPQFTFFSDNSYQDSSDVSRYLTTAPAVLYALNRNSGVHAWYNAPSGTAGNAISFTQAMTLDASGNLGVGTTSPAGRTHINLTATNTPGLIVTNDSFTGSYNAGRIRLGSYTAGTYGADIYAIQTSFADDMGLGFATFPASGSVPVERARITSGGYFKASDDGAYGGSATGFHEFNQSIAGQGVLTLYGDNASTTAAGMLFIETARNTTNNTYYAISYYNTGAAAYKFRVADSGNVTNTNGSYGTISDAKMKTDIVDAGSQWADIKAVRFRKFKMKDDPQQITQLGVVAQELEQTSPGLVDEHADRDAEGNDLGTTTKSVKSSILLMKAAVALQEAMARIEQLEAKFAALESK